MRINQYLRYLDYYGGNFSNLIYTICDSLKWVFLDLVSLYHSTAKDFMSVQATRPRFWPFFVEYRLTLRQSKNLQVRLANMYLVKLAKNKVNFETGQNISDMNIYLK